MNVDNRLFACKQKQAHYDNKDLVELKPGDIVQIVPIGSGAKEPVKAVVQSKVGIRAYELHTENGRVCFCATSVKGVDQCQLSLPPSLRSWLL